MKAKIMFIGGPECGMGTPHILGQPTPQGEIVQIDAQTADAQRLIEKLKTNRFFSVEIVSEGKKSGAAG